jgi:acetyl esterase/lipase
MKKFYILIVTSLSLMQYNSSLAQPKIAECTDICDINFVNPIYSTVFETSAINYGNGTTNMHDVKYRNDEMYDETCPPPLSDQVCVQNQNALHYNVFYPDYADYAACPLPCVFVIHGGGFFECSSSDGIQEWCRQFASRGIIAVNIEYRRGQKPDPDPTHNFYISVQQVLAVYRGSQDVRGAMRSFIKRMLNEGTFNDPFRVDLNEMFIAGESAGGVLAMTAAYYDQSMMNALYPVIGTGVSIQSALGDLDADYYYGEPLTYEYITHIKAIMIKSSGMYVPESYSSNPEDFFVNSPNIPAIFFHGEKDIVFKPDREDKSFSPKKDHLEYNTEDYCLFNSPFKVEAKANTLDVIVFGLRGIRDNIFIPNGIISEVYIDCQAAHVLDADGAGFHSDFGTLATTQQDVIEYMVERGCTFFQAKLAGILGSLNKNYFVECKNNRYQCDPADNFDNTCCTDCSSTDVHSKCCKSQQ